MWVMHWFLLLGSSSKNIEIWDTLGCYLSLLYHYSPSIPSPRKKKTCFYWILLLYHLIVFCFSLFIFGCVPVISHKENFQNFRWVPSSFKHPFKLTLMPLYLNKFNVMHCNPVFILKIFVQHVKLNEVFLRVWLAG